LNNGSKGIKCELFGNVVIPSVNFGLIALMADGSDFNELKSKLEGGWKYLVYEFNCLSNVDIAFYIMQLLLVICVVASY